MKFRYRLYFWVIVLFIINSAYGTPIRIADHNTVYSFKVHNQKYWVKGVPLKKQFSSHCIKKKILSLILPFSLLRPSVNCGLGSLEIEKKNLYKALRAGVNVPRIIATTSTFLIINDLGQSFEKVVQDQLLHQRLLLLYQAQLALIDMHHKNIVQGRGMIKDMVINQQNEIGFIDMAENPTDFMSLTHAKARDWIGFLYSALPLLSQAHQAALTETVLNKVSFSEYKILYKLFQQLEFIHWFIKPFSKIIGQDGQRGLILLDNLKLYFTYKRVDLKTPQR